MSCAHCCFACTAKGRDMTLRVYKKALDRASERGDYVTLGGGEPTLHPRFWEFLSMALAKEFTSHVEGLFLVTNGSQTNTALALAKLARQGVLGCALSRDQWHDPIDPKVVAAFTRDTPRELAWRWRERMPEGVMDLREIRSVDQQDRLVNQGRCDFGDMEECGCDGSPFVCPDGRVRQCGCIDAPIVGDVFKGFKDLDPQREWRCYRSFSKNEVDDDDEEENEEEVEEEAGSAAEVAAAHS